MKLAIVFFLLSIVNVDSLDRNRLKVRPGGMENFDLQKYMGKWYLYASTQPCTWNGATQLKEWVYTYNMDADGKSFTVEEHWRKDGSCTFTKAKATLMSEASLKVVDQIGDLWSGSKIIACTDYNNYVIAWGCVNESIHSGICDDYWFSVKTRTPKLSQIYVDEINKKLYQLWGTSMSDMQLISHSHPCDQPLRRPGKMFKIY